ncbi:camp-dependent protein kinase regulatory subunit [Cystobasidium minutum MCA 4210]|uniref:camp-dependent protein kinase regulatory subunit n=1 Tax=Cystobasidium minutum MCA 4210 TaxID=1397322 RepID=UPI0034CF898F|eukprot:jgi/Rhomi1/144216/e_gw1.4.851.1
MHNEDEEDTAARISEGRDRLGAISPGNNRNGSGLPSSGSSSSLSGDNGIPQGYNLGRRTSVSAESIDPNSLSNSAHATPKVVIPKTPSQRARIESSTEKNLLFRNLDEEQHNDVVNAMKEVQVTQGTEVIVQGAVGDFFYVVESGDFQIWVKPQQSSGMVMSPTMPSSSSNNARGRSVSVEPEGSMKEDMQATTTLEDGTTVRADGSKLVATITSGGSFGELALMYNAPRAATVVCSSENATLWALDRVTFRTILMEHTSKKRRMYEKFLSEVPILVSLENYERSKIADALEERIYEEGEDVVREGELGKNFYIIESGKAEVLKRKEGGVQERVGTLTKGDYFGELALLNSAPRAATVRAVSGRLRVATLGEKAFTRLLGPVVEILTRSAVTKYGAQSVASGEALRGGPPKENHNNAATAARHERERSGTSTPTTAAAGREREDK